MSSIERSGKNLYRSENPSLLGSGFRVFKIATKTDDIIMEGRKTAFHFLFWSPV